MDRGQGQREQDAFREKLKIITSHSELVFGEKEQSGLLAKLQRRIIALKLGTAEDYCRYLNAHLKTELPELIALATTHHTAFFREFVHFQALEGELLKRAFESSGRRKIRVWSAAASRGHEAYSLAMFFESLQSSLGAFDYEILATDIDEQSLQVARNGVYPAKEVHQSPASYLGTHWARGTAGLEGWMKAKDSLRRKIKFSQANLLKLGVGEPGGRFDFIFCRNVYLYFTRAQIEHSTKHLLSCLEPWGALFLGVCENLMDLDLPVESRGHSIFQHRSALRNERPVGRNPGEESRIRGSSQAPSSLTAPIVPSSEELPPIRVIVVDDSPTILALMKKILTREEGFEVVATAQTLAQTHAEMVSRGKQIDLMTLDLHLKGETGIDYLASIPSQEKDAHPPIVIVSALGRESESLARQALEKGAADYVEKPDMARMSEMAEELRSKLKTAARRKLKNVGSSSKGGSSSPASRTVPSKLSVVVVDDSPTMTRVLEKMIHGAKAADGTVLEVVACVTDPLEIESVLRKKRPQVMTLDMNMPGMTGVDVLRALPENLRIPTLVVSALGLEQGSLVLDALALGAIDYFAKPSLPELALQSGVLVEKIVMASRARAISRPRSFARPAVSNAHSNALQGHKTGRTVVGIGASTGGTEAIRVVLAGLPLDTPPICIVQHIPPIFSAAFARRLSDVCRRPVEEVVDGQTLEDGVTYIAPGDHHFQVENRGGRLFAKLTQDALRGGHRPSVDVLFESLAQLKEFHVVAALLTGMGKDGAEGLLRLRNMGASTVCQSERSCVVFGMPRVAIEKGAAAFVEDLEAISGRLVECLSSRGRGLKAG